MDYATRIATFDASMLPRIKALFATFFPAGDRLLSERYHTWLCAENPCGPAKIVTISLNEVWAGFMALIPVTVGRSAERRMGYYAVNVLVDPGHQGKNLFSRMITPACELALEENAVLIGHPNAAALRFWQRKRMHFGADLRPALAIPGLGRLKLAPRRVRTADDLSSAAELLGASDTPSDHWKVLASPEFLDWRFLSHPTNRYEITMLERRGAPVAVQVVRRITPFVHLFMDQWAAPSWSDAATHCLPLATIHFTSTEATSGPIRGLVNLPLKRRMPFFATDFAAPACPGALANLGLSATDL